jgi:hypothetical protein
VRRITIVLALLVPMLVTPPVAAEHVTSFGFGGVVDLAYDGVQTVAMDDGGFAALTYTNIVRYRADGSVAWNVGNSGHPAIESDGERVFTSNEHGIVALGSDGQPDAAFGDDGTAEVADVSSFDVAPDGRVLVRTTSSYVRFAADGTKELDVAGTAGEHLVGVLDGGSFFTQDADGTVRRRTASGAVDSSWAHGGLVPPAGFGGFAVGPDGELVASATRYHDEFTTTEVLLARWTPAGDPDAGFGLGGIASAEVRCGSEVVREVEIGPDGTIYVLGMSFEYREAAPPFIAAFSTTGRLAGFEDLGTSSPYSVIGRDLHFIADLAVPRAGRVGALVSADDGRARLHVLALSDGFDGPDADSAYWLVNRDGVWSRGLVSQCAPLDASRDIVGAAAGATPYGYWMVDASGHVETAGKVAHHGQVSTPLNARVLGITARPQGDGYWIVAGDGGIFSFGGARFFGSTGAIRLNQPILGMAATPSGRGYWLVARDGGIFSFGDAQFFGSTGAIRLNQPIVGMAATPSGNGYWLVARDGGIFSFGDAEFFGSTGAIRLNQPIVGMAPTSTGRGYWLVAADGGVFTFGDAEYLGSSYDDVLGPHGGWVGIITP